MANCTHAVVMKDMCAVCGKDLRRREGRPGEREVFTEARVAMVHNIPELIVSPATADDIGDADVRRLLKSRKLVLLVDLDQTLIHTTNEDVSADVLNDAHDVFHYQLYGPASPWYHTRLRPHTREFLRTVAEHYELHICTFGVRVYAHKVAEILDPTRALFGHRILSRDECFDANLKTSNLKALFPSGEFLVCIIDDRSDVWNMTPNLVHVKPYRFFQNTGDINAPAGFSKESPNGAGSSTDSSVVAGGAASARSNGAPASAAVSDTASSAVRKVVDDEDDYLHYLEDILVRVHTAFYQVYDLSVGAADVSDTSSPPLRLAKAPDLRTIVPYVRHKVLAGCNIAFSAIIPTGVNPLTHPLVKLALDYGASLHEKPVYEDTANCKKTTHLVVGGWGTPKIKEVLQRGGNGIHVLTAQWLQCCAERWEHVDERLFVVTKDNVYDVFPQYAQYSAVAASSSRKKDDDAGALKPSAMKASASIPDFAATLSDADESVAANADEACSREPSGAITQGQAGCDAREEDDPDELVLICETNSTQARDRLVPAVATPSTSARGPIEEIVLIDDSDDDGVGEREDDDEVVVLEGPAAKRLRMEASGSDEGEVDDGGNESDSSIESLDRALQFHLERLDREKAAALSSGDVTFVAPQPADDEANCEQLNGGCG